MKISLTDNLCLIAITIDRYKDLYELMSRIYPPAYTYLWGDKGAWYLQQIYGIAQVEEDINEENSFFYFVQVEGLIEGILKIQHKSYPDQPDQKATRLHRIYLSENIQGHGVSKILMEYIHDLARQNGSKILWLDCMDSKVQALKYYEKNGFEKGTLSQLPYDGLVDKYRGIYLMWKSL